MPLSNGRRSERTRVAMTTSSSEALPARSPMPLIVHSTWRAPPVSAARVFATARPRSSWQCVLHTTWSELGTRLIRPGEERLDLVGRRVADRVGQVDGLGARLDHRLDDVPQEVGIAARRILGGELHVVGEGARQADRVHRHLEAVRARHAQLALEVQVRGGDERRGCACASPARAPRRRARCRRGCSAPARRSPAP